MTTSTDGIYVVPTIKFCPSCGSENLADEHWHVGDPNGLIEGTNCTCGPHKPKGEDSVTTSCAACGTHFTVSGRWEWPEE